MLNFTRLDEIRAKKPLVHCISNIVTANDCANVGLAMGASPMMAQAPEEMRELTAISSATVLNTGTPDREKYESCLLCGTAAAAMGQPVVLDPVGVGASSWRLEQMHRQLQAYTPTILRVNLGEARALLRQTGQERGVDSLVAADDRQRLEAAAALAQELHTAVLLTGAQDIVTDGLRSWKISGGSDYTTSITGSGCMLSVVCGAFAAVEPDAAHAAVLASAFWKTCAQRAAEEANGPGSFRVALMDAAGTLTGAKLGREARIEELS